MGKRNKTIGVTVALHHRFMMMFIAALFLLTQTLAASHDATYADKIHSHNGQVCTLSIANHNDKANCGISIQVVIPLNLTLDKQPELTSEPSRQTQLSQDAIRGPPAL